LALGPNIATNSTVPQVFRGAVEEEKGAMQIAMISYWSCPLTTLGIGRAGGMSVYLLNLAQTLGELGHTVDIYTAGHQEEDTVDTTLDSHVSVIHLDQRTENPYHDIDHFTEQMEAAARDRGAQYDVVHAHYYYSGLVGLKICERLNIPLVVTFHTLGTMKQRYLGVEDRRRIQAESVIVAGADGIIASTELEKADVIEWHHVPDAKIHVVHPGVDHHLFRPHNRASAREIVDLPPESKIILFVGRIDPIKGIDLLIDAFAQIVAAGAPNSRSSRLLVIGGDPENESFWTTGEGNNLRQQIQDARLEERVSFVGSQPHAQLAYYYAAADVVAMPSAYETFGLAALEAMACGACVVASRVGGLQYLIQDRENGRLFEPGNVEELAAVIGELLGDREQRERLGRQAADASYQYCWSTQAEKVLGVYQSLVYHAA
jgi:D-inositol-3-phosphate glycosyltransferase